MTPAAHLPTPPQLLGRRVWLVALLLLLQAGACGEGVNTAATLTLSAPDSEDGVEGGALSLGRSSQGLTLMAPARGGDRTVLARPFYNYAPTVMYDNGKYRMWWCGLLNEQSAGDRVLYSESDSLDGGWHAADGKGDFQEVFRGTFTLRKPTFDTISTCDPSVVYARGKYYLYYGASPGTYITPHTTEIGVAVSEDGIHDFRRLNGGKAIIKAKNSKIRAYGAGQPSVVFKDGLFYMTFTDTTGSGGVKGAYNVQYAMRSPDPTFQSEVEELGPTGFAPYSAARHATYVFAPGASLDWAYSDALQMFVMASSGTAGMTRIRFFDRALKQVGDSFSIPGLWVEGPGLVTRPDGHLLPHADPQRAPIDFMHSYIPPGTKLDPTKASVYFGKFSHGGADVSFPSHYAAARIGLPYEGMHLLCTGLPDAVVVDGKRVLMGSSKVPPLLSKNQHRIDRDEYNRLPLGGSLYNRAPAISTPGLPSAFIDPVKKVKFPASCAKIFEANGSEPRSVSRDEYNSYPIAGHLRCIE